MSHPVWHISVTYEPQPHRNRIHPRPLGLHGIDGRARHRRLQQPPSRTAGTARQRTLQPRAVRRSLRSSRLITAHRRGAAAQHQHLSTPRLHCPARCDRTHDRRTRRASIQHARSGAPRPSTRRHPYRRRGKRLTAIQLEGHLRSHPPSDRCLPMALPLPRRQPGRNRHRRPDEHRQGKFGQLRDGRGFLPIGKKRAQPQDEGHAPLRPRQAR